MDKGVRMARIGKNIKMYRDKAGMTQEDLAGLVGLSGGAQIAQFESGVKLPSLEKAADIATQLGVTVDALLHGEGGTACQVTNNANGDHQTVYQHVSASLVTEESLELLRTVMREELAELLHALETRLRTVLHEAVPRVVRSSGDGAG